MMTTTTMIIGRGLRIFGGPPAKNCFVWERHFLRIQNFRSTTGQLLGKDNSLHTLDHTAPYGSIESKSSQLSV